MWISNIQKSIDFIETHLTENIDIGDIAKEALSSPFQYQRVFYILCGYTVGEYIRYRRLTLAAADLLDKNSKVIDIAYKYCYETPESFTRAFKAFHGINPIDVKKGANIKNFSKISVKLILQGGNKMEYRIEKLPTFKVLCKRTKVEKPDFDVAPQDITNFWAECGQNGTTAKIISHYKEDEKLKGLLGICFSKDLNANHFPYGIGVKYDGNEQIDDLEIVEIPAYTYVVFKCRGKMPEAFQNTYKKIVSEFFPQNDKFEYCYGVELEVYPSEDILNENYECEIWIAVKEH